MLALNRELRCRLFEPCLVLVRFEIKEDDVWLAPDPQLAILFRATHPVVSPARDHGETRRPERCRALHGLLKIFFSRSGDAAACPASVDSVTVVWETSGAPILKARVLLKHSPRSGGLPVHWGIHKQSLTHVPTHK